MKKVDVAQVSDILRKGGSARLDHPRQPKFKVNDVIIAKSMNHFGHIRLPEYVQGHQGVIHKIQGSFIFPGSHVAEHKEPQFLYSVRFDSKELWGDQHSESPCAVYVDLFESYMETK